MNPTQSTPRSSEAALLEADYLLRLHEALGHCPRSEAAEIEENVTGHIHAAVAELETEEVSLSQMAQILEELGPPEGMVSDPVDDVPAMDFREKAPKTEEFGSSETPASRIGDREFLDRLLAGYLIVTFGLFVPVIEIYFCAIIGFAVIWRILGKAPTAEIAGARPWAAIAMLSAAAMFPATLLARVEELLGIFLLPVVIAWAVSDIVLYWIIFGGLANWLDGIGMTDLASETRNRRIYYILVSFVVLLLAIPVGLIVANDKSPLAMSLAGYALLPLTWLINWFLILKPILGIRKKIP